MRMRNLRYKDLEELYPETVILRKVSEFYRARNDSARVMHALFDYNGWRTTRRGQPIIGFHERNLESVCKTLESNNISYVVVIGL